MAIDNQQGRESLVTQLAKANAIQPTTIGLPVVENKLSDDPETIEINKILKAQENEAKRVHGEGAISPTKEGALPSTENDAAYAAYKAAASLRESK